MTEKSTVARKRIDAQLRAAVIRGVRLLDAKDSAWWNGKNTPPAIRRMTDHINLATLDMSVGESCVIGQRAGGRYFAGARLLGLSNMDDQIRHGFNSWAHAGAREWSILTELWASVIQSRRYPRRKIASDPWVRKANRTWKRP